MATDNIISTTLSSATSTSQVLGKNVDVHLYDSSSFDGTWEVQRKINERWCIVATGTETDLPYDRVCENGKALPVRVTVSAYTSGTLGIEMA
jgi:hypothetical protein